MIARRHQPPAYSPVPGVALRHALARPSRSAEDPRIQLMRELHVAYDAPVVHLLQSGTAALEMGIRIARALAGGGPVALPAFGCYDLATAAIGAGAPVVLYDVDPATLAPDMDSLAALLLEGARVVVVAPVAGVPADWDAVHQCLGAFGAIAIEDAAQSNGAFWRRRPCGTFGQMSVLSFGRGKGWTGARGGALLVRNTLGSHIARGLTLRDASRMDELAAIGAGLALAALAHPARYAIPAAIPWLHLGETRYHAPRGCTRMTAFAASLALATRDAAHVEAELRKANARTLLDAIEAGVHVRTIAVPPLGEAGWLRLPVRVTGGWRALSRARQVAALGIAPAYPATLAKLGVVRERLRGAGPWPGAETLVRELVTLPTHTLVSPRERQAISSLLAEWQHTDHRAVPPAAPGDARSYKHL